MKFIHLISILISILISPTSCFGGYSQEELDLFDLYDELRHTTFYKFLSDPSKNIDLNPKSTKKEIKSAYKKKALKWHPDKWKQENEEDAKIDTKEKVDKRFRQLSAIKEILLDEENLKKTYDNVLKNGLPPGMSFRYVRAVMKMSVKQVLIFVFVIVWGVHYLCLWGRWLEKKWAISDLQSRKVSKKKARELESLVIEKPGFKDTLPFLIWQLLVFTVTVLPGQIKEARQEAENARLLAAEQKKQQEEDQEEYEKQKIEKEKQRKINQEKHLVWVEEQRKIAAKKYEEALAAAEAQRALEDEAYAELEGEWNSSSEDEGNNKKSKKKKNKKSGKNRRYQELMGETKSEPLKEGPFTDEETAKMVELMNKWPGGTSNRWGRIAEELNRSEKDVTKQLKIIKANDSQSNLKTITISSDSKDKQNVNASNTSGDEWSKAQQTALEKALKVFTKEYEGDRWGEISKCVDGKSKKECVERYKQIVLALRESKLPK